MSDQISEFYICIRDVLIRDTWNGDIPNWIFHVTTLDCSDNPIYENLGSFRRKNYRYTILIDESLSTKPSKEQCKKLAQWQHEQIIENQNQYEGFISWQHRK